MYHQQFRRCISKRSYSNYVHPCCDLDLADSKLFSCMMTLQLIRIYHHTKFGYKSSKGSGDTVQTKICHWHLKPSLSTWPCIHQSNFSLDTPAYDVEPSNQVWLQTDHTYRKYSQNIHILAGFRKEQAGSRREQGCTDQIPTSSDIIEQCTEWQRQL